MVWATTAVVVRCWLWCWCPSSARHGDISCSGAGPPRSCVELQACLKQTLGAGPPGQSSSHTQLGPCGLMDKAPDFGSGDCRFESCHGRTFYHFQFIMELLGSVTSQRICNVILGDLRAMIPYDSTQYTTHKPRVLLRNRFKLFIQLYASLELSTLLVPC